MQWDSGSFFIGVAVGAFFAAVIAREFHLISAEIMKAKFSRAFQEQRELLKREGEEATCPRCGSSESDVMLCCLDYQPNDFGMHLQTIYGQVNASDACGLGGGVEESFGKEEITHQMAMKVHGLTSDGKTYLVKWGEWGPLQGGATGLRFFRREVEIRVL